MILLDCTFRDGGYYNAWNFSEPLINQYLDAMSTSGVDVVELGLRSLHNNGFKGATAYTTDKFIRGLSIPKNLTVGVMLNASELLEDIALIEVLELLFPHNAAESPVSVVRIASHVHEFHDALPAVTWLKERGYIVGFNLMQIADRTQEEIIALAKEASSYPLDVLYFADSMGSMTPDHTTQIIAWLRTEYKGPLGIHTHDNLGLALSNTLRALDEGVTWVDATVTGMGRGPGNARTEELAIEVAERRKNSISFVSLMQLLRKYFIPMQKKYGWGTNPYYYLSGKYGIHPTYVQQMLSDSRFGEEDILAVLEHLRQEGGKKYNVNTLDAARHFYHSNPTGTWHPKEIFAQREVLVLGTGPGVDEHKVALEYYIREKKPIVLALNAQQSIEAELIDYRVACHHVRLLADCDIHTQLPQPLITPYSMLPSNIKEALRDKTVLDFGINVAEGQFGFGDTYCTVPTFLVVAYALAVITSGQAKSVLMAGFDGFGSDDPRSHEMQIVLDIYQKKEEALSLQAITPTRYKIKSVSIYGI